MGFVIRCLIALELFLVALLAVRWLDGSGSGPVESAAGGIENIGSPSSSHRFAGEGDRVRVAEPYIVRARALEGASAHPPVAVATGPSLCRQGGTTGSVVVVGGFPAVGVLGIDAEDADLASEEI